MSSPLKPLRHSTWAGPSPGPEAQGLPQRAPGLPLNLHEVSGPTQGALGSLVPALTGAEKMHQGLAWGELAGSPLPVRTEPSLTLLGFSLSDSLSAGPSPP